MAYAYLFKYIIIGDTGQCCDTCLAKKHNKAAPPDVSFVTAPPTT